MSRYCTSDIFFWYKIYALVNFYKVLFVLLPLGNRVNSQTPFQKLLINCFRLTILNCLHLIIERANVLSSLTHTFKSWRAPV